MKICLAFDSYKGCLSAADVCKAATEGLFAAKPDAEVMSFPLSDGGEGLVDCFISIGKVHPVQVVVHGPLMEKVIATYAISPDNRTAYIEMASACGLTLVSPCLRNPMLTTSYGLGELLLDAQSRGVNQVVLGIGGSATCDAGDGMLKALGDNLLSDMKITVACDVTNPLYGPSGAAFVFAPQKGATPEQVDLLDMRLRTFARITEKRGFASPADALKPGTGAAGGLGYALLTYLNAELRSGIDIVLDSCGFDAQLCDANLVITGEGCSDMQTINGKVASGVLRRSKLYGIKTILMSGQIHDSDKLLAWGFNQLYCVNEGDPRPIELLMQPDVAAENIRKCCMQLMNEYK